MKQYTLLEIVQSVMDSIGSDPITTIESNLTEDADQLLSIIKDEYFLLSSQSDWKYLRVFGQLTAVADANYPNYLKVPDDIENLEVVKYNIKELAADPDNFQEIEFIEDPDVFLARSHALDSTATNVQEVTDYGGGTYLIKNDKVPSCFTTFDDDYLVFDSILSTLDATLPANKSAFVGYKAPTFTIANATVLDMPGRMFPNFIERVKAVAHADINQSDSPIHRSKEFATTTRIHSRKSKTMNPRGTRRTRYFGRK